jgi:hypothetical protein
MAIDPFEVSNYLDLDAEAIQRLTKRFFYRTPKVDPQRKKSIDRAALAEEWKSMLDSGTALSRADIARKLGVSRAWVSKVMRCLAK